MGELTEMAKTALDKGLCLRCTGRLTGKLGTGLTNLQRGAILKLMMEQEGSGPGLDGGQEHYLSISQDPPKGGEDSKECSLCEGLFLSLEDLVEVVDEALGEWEYDTFLLGNRPDPEMVEKEEKLWAELGALNPEPLKTELNRAIGKKLWEITGKEVDFKTPDVVAVLDILYHFVEVEANPVFFYGRYRKLERGIPQTRWPCRQCKGKGCDRCSNTGKMYPTSVEELVCASIMKELEGDEHSFHGMGREDIDARMLGTGRPFVAEVKHPRKRKLDLDAMEKKINADAKDRVEISGFRISSKSEVRGIKDAAPDKSYKVGVKFESDLADDAISKIEMLKGVELEQRTPTRVNHRRADKVRRRRVHDIGVERIAPDTLDICIKAASGTYIKEFCHGDENRTIPSVSDSVGTPCSVLYLDVLGIHDVEE